MMCLRLINDDDDDFTCTSRHKLKESKMVISQESFQLCPNNVCSDFIHLELQYLQLAHRAIKMTALFLSVSCYVHLARFPQFQAM